VDFNLSEMAVVAVVALLVIGPKDLPKALRVLGYWVGRARGVARQFRQGFDSMIREAELEEMEKKWAAENERIMREHSTPAPTPPVEALSAPEPQPQPVVMVEKPVVEAASDVPSDAAAPATAPDLTKATS